MSFKYRNSQGLSMASRRFLNWSDDAVEVWLMISPIVGQDDFLFRPVSASRIKGAIRDVSSIEETMEALGINQELLELSMLAWLENKWETDEDDEENEGDVYGKRLVLGIREKNDWEHNLIMKLQVPLWMFFMLRGMYDWALFDKNEGIVLFNDRQTFTPNLWTDWDMTQFSQIVQAAIQKAMRDAEKETS